MNKKNIKAIIMLLTAAQAVPAHAMLGRLSQTAIRIGALSSTPSLTTDAHSQSLRYLQDFRSSRPTLLACNLATKLPEQRYEHDSEQSNDEKNNQHRTLLGLGLLGGAALAAYSNDDLFEKKIAHADMKEDIVYGVSAVALAAGGIYWWYNRPTCKTPEDLNDLSKLNRTIQHFAEGSIGQYYEKIVFQKLVKDNFKLITPEASNVYTLSIISNMNTIFKNENQELIYTWMELNPHSIPLLIKATFDSFSHIACYKSGSDFISYILLKYPETLETFKRIAINEYNKIITNTYGIKILAEIILSCKQTGPFSLPEELTDRIKMINETLNIILNAPNTPTVQHFKACFPRAFANLQYIFFVDSNADRHRVKELIQQIILIEKYEQKLGNYTFLHGYPWQLHFFQDIDGHLRSALTSHGESNISLRFIKQPNCINTNRYKEKREKILEQGTPRQYRNDIPDIQKNIIFMNTALFANISGENTFGYILLNAGINPPNFNILEKIFDRLNINTHLIKYREEFENLQKLHNNANNLGAGILFSFTPEMLEKSVYVSYPGGIKRSIYIDGIGETDDIKLIMETLRKTPEKIHFDDVLEFIFVITKDCGLNPHVQESGNLKIIPLNTADPELYAIYEQKRDELIAKIKADIEAERAAWSEEEKLAHETTRLQMEAWHKKNNCLAGCEQESRVQEA